MSNKKRAKAKVSQTRQGQSSHWTEHPVRWSAAIAAVTASVAMIMSNYETIRCKLIKDCDINVHIGWMSIADPKDLSCVLKDNSKFTLVKGRDVSLLNNACL